MPYVNIQMVKGATRDQRAEVVREVTETLSRVLGKDPDHTHVVIQEIEADSWGFGGTLIDELRKKEK